MTKSLGVRVLVTLAILVVLLISFVFVRVSYFAWQMQPWFGVVMLDLGTEPAVYLKRQARGLNYDEIGLSLVADRCVALDPAVDYIFKSKEPSFGLAYRLDGDTLHVYEGIDEPAPPLKSSHFPVTVVRHPRAPSLWAESASEKQGMLGYRRVFVEFDDSVCRSFVEVLFGL